MWKLGFQLLARSTGSTLRGPFLNLLQVVTLGLRIAGEKGCATDRQGATGSGTLRPAQRETKEELSPHSRSEVCGPEEKAGPFPSPGRLSDRTP